MADVLHFRNSLGDSHPPAAAAEPQPILVAAKQAAAMLAIGLRTFRSMDAAGKLPAPVRLSAGCVRWRLAELTEWVAAGAPPRDEWEARKRVR